MRCWITALLITAALASGCATTDSPREGLAALTDQQEELANLDERAADFDFAADGVSEARAIADDYADLLERARESRPGDASGDEAVVWDTFLEILELRSQAAGALVEGVESGDLSEMQARIDELNRQTVELNRRFNEALSHIRGEEPPD